MNSPNITSQGKLQFGIVTDVHHEVIHDAVDRISAFTKAMNAAQADFVISLGDFCMPLQSNLPLIEGWETFAGPRYHVLGNHDMDGGFTREQTFAFFGMPARYYSFDQKGIHFVILDGNDPDSVTKGYARSINAEQLQWLASDLEATSLPTIIFIHQPFDGQIASLYGIHYLTNGDKVREILALANQDAGFQKVLAVFSGHAHLDYVRQVDGIPHVQINSTSYLWIGKQHETYSPEVVKKTPLIDGTCPYAQPLWAFVTLDLERGEMAIQGRQSTFIGPDPWELDMPPTSFAIDREICRPAISDRTFKYRESL